MTVYYSKLINLLDDIDELMALGSVDEDVMCKYVLKFYEQAVKKSYNSNLESILELGILCGKQFLYSFWIILDLK